jgi:hypothetical protein
MVPLLLVLLISLADKGATYFAIPLTLQYVQSQRFEETTHHSKTVSSFHLYRWVLCRLSLL